MSRPTPFDFTQPSDFRISKVLNYMIVGLDKDGNIHEDITNPDYEAWFLFRLGMMPLDDPFFAAGAIIAIVTDGNHWFKIGYTRSTWPEPMNDNWLHQLKLTGADNINSINLHPSDKASINETIKDLMQKEEYSLHT